MGSFMSRRLHTTVMNSKSLRSITVQAGSAQRVSTPSTQKLPDSFYAPKSQPFYIFTNGAWLPATSSAHPTARSISAQTLRLLTWNIDMQAPFPSPRMAGALAHLSALIAALPASQPVIVFLQEMSVSDLQQIQEAPWIRARFLITDLDATSWKSPVYGTTALADRRLCIKEVFRVPWVSRFGRDGLFVDVELDVARPGSPDGASGARGVLRLCNTHLESLVADPPVRPLQLAAAAEYLRERDVRAALLAGDLNAIQPFDRQLHSTHGLRDAYLELGGVEDAEEGFTWGFQVPEWMRRRFGCSRMDKVLVCGDLEAVGLERIGMGVRVEDEGIMEEMEEGGMGEWVTDHYGLMAEVRLTRAGIPMRDDLDEGYSRARF